MWTTLSLLLMLAAPKTPPVPEADGPVFNQPTTCEGAPGLLVQRGGSEGGGAPRFSVTMSVFTDGRLEFSRKSNTLDNSFECELKGTLSAKELESLTKKIEALRGLVGDVSVPEARRVMDAGGGGFCYFLDGAFHSVSYSYRPKKPAVGEVDNLLRALQKKLEAEARRAKPPKKK